MLVQHKVNNFSRWSLCSWSALILFLYYFGAPNFPRFAGHPLPLTPQVPFLLFGLYFFGAFFLASIGFGQQLRYQLLRPHFLHLAILPIFVYATLIVLPSSPFAFWQLWLFALLWGIGTRLAYQRWQLTGGVAMMLLWFPGNPQLVFSFWGWTPIVAVIIAISAWPKPKKDTTPLHWGWLFPILAAAAYITLATVQKDFGPYKFLSGIMPTAAWTAYFGSI